MLRARRSSRVSRTRPALRRPQRGLARTRSRRFDAARSPTRTPPWRRTTRRPRPSPTASPRKAGKASGAAAEVLTASAGLARDKGLRGAVAQVAPRSGDDLLEAVHAAVEQFVTIFTGMGGLMAERVTDLRDIERRIVARLVGEPEPGVPTPTESPCVLVAEDLAPADTAGLDPTVVLALVTERGGPTSHTAIIARQLGIPCVVGTAGASTIAGRHPAARRRHRRHDRDRPRRGGGRPTGRRRPRAARRPGLLGRPGRAPPTASRSGSSPTSPTASPPARPQRRRSRGSGCSAPSCASSTGKDEPTVEEQAEIYGEVLDAVRTDPDATVRRGPHPRRRLGQAARVRDPRRARRTPRSASAACGCRSATPACSSASSTRSPLARQAHRHRDLGDGADGGDRRRGGRLRGPGARRAGSRPG